MSRIVISAVIAAIIIVGVYFSVPEALLSR